VEPNTVSWRELIEDQLMAIGLSWNDIESIAGEEGMDLRFYSGYGGTEGTPFTVWTSDWVLFPICYDGAEWVGKAPRNPNGVAMEHQGGG
jgi:hypothetical protein